MGEIRQLFVDKTQTVELYPKTTVEAVKYSDTETLKEVVDNIKKGSGVIRTIGFDQDCTYICDGISDNEQFQEAIDYASNNSEKGIIISVCAGNYTFTQSVLLKSNIKIIMDDNAVIKLADQVIVSCTNNSSNPKLVSVSADDILKFKVGMEVGLCNSTSGEYGIIDLNSYEFKETGYLAIIDSIDVLNNIIVLRNVLDKKYDSTVSNYTYLCTLNSAFRTEIYESNPTELSENIHIYGGTIDCNKDKQPLSIYMKYLLYDGVKEIVTKYDNFKYSDTYYNADKSFNTGISISFSKNIILSDINIRNGIGNGISVHKVDNCNISNCNIDNCNNTGIVISYNDYKIIKSNTISNCFTTNCNIGVFNNGAGSISNINCSDNKYGMYNMVRYSITSNSTFEKNDVGMMMIVYNSLVEQCLFINNYKSSATDIDESGSILITRGKYNNVRNCGITPGSPIKISTHTNNAQTSFFTSNNEIYNIFSIGDPNNYSVLLDSDFIGILQSDDPSIEMENNENTVMYINKNNIQYLGYRDISATQPISSTETKNIRLIHDPIDMLASLYIDNIYFSSMSYEAHQDGDMGTVTTHIGGDPFNIGVLHTNFSATSGRSNPYRTFTNGHLILGSDQDSGFIPELIMLDGNPICTSIIELTPMDQIEEKDRAMYSSLTIRGEGDIAVFDEPSSKTTLYTDLEVSKDKTIIFDYLSPRAKPAIDLLSITASTTEIINKINELINGVALMGLIERGFVPGNIEIPELPPLGE